MANETPMDVMNRMTAKKKKKVVAPLPPPKPQKPYPSTSAEDDNVPQWVLDEAQRVRGTVGKKKGGSIKKYARGGGIESKGKTKGRFV